MKKYRFEVRWEDWAEFEVEAENEADAFEKIADRAAEYEYTEQGLPPYLESAFARIIEVDGDARNGDWDAIK